MSGMDWDSVAYRNGEQHSGNDFATGSGLPKYDEQKRKVRVEVKKWKPRLYVDGQEVSLDPYIKEGYEEITEWDKNKREEVVVGRQSDDAAMEQYWEGAIEGYRFRIKSVKNMVDTEVIEPDGTTWTTRSGFTGWMDKCSPIPWTPDWYNA